MKTETRPLIEQYKSVQIRYSPLRELDDAITKCIELDWNLNFLPAEEQESLLKTQSMIQRLYDKLQRDAEKLANKLKRN